MIIRRSTAQDFDAVLAVINDAARAYRGVIPADCWHEPYMTPAALRHEIAQQVMFDVMEADAGVCGVMGIQDKGEVVLIRHAYVATQAQRQGIGSRLLRQLLARTSQAVLIGTWSAATWAIDFYLRHDFRLVTKAEQGPLLSRYWSVSARQMESSVVLADRRWPGQSHRD